MHGGQEMGKCVGACRELVGKAVKGAEVCMAGQGQKIGNHISDVLVDGVLLC